VQPKIYFEKILNTREHIDYLYTSLEKRTHNVSHRQMPSYDEHKVFVNNHPYRTWMLVKMSKDIIGNFYLQKDNSIGVHLDEGKFEFFSQTIDAILRKWKPLEGIKSIRNQNFVFNVAYGNNDLVKELENIGAQKIQSTYLIK